MDIYGRLERWLDFLSEYQFPNDYKSDANNGAADFLFRYGYSERSLDDGCNEGEIPLIVLGDQEDSELHFLDVQHY